MNRKIKFSLITGIPAISYFIFRNFPKLNILNGFAAKNVCTGTFEAGRDLKSIEAGENSFLPISFAKNEIDFSEKSVTSSVLGLKKRKAIFREGLGCVLLPENTLEIIKDLPIPERKFQHSKLPYPFGNGEPQKQPLPIDYTKLDKAVDKAFDPEGKELRKTRSVLVLHKDQLVLERYDSGFNSITKFSGWSMTKSITSAVTGIMVKKGILSLEQDRLFPQWDKDSRSKITLNNLLQMNSGLQWKEDYTSISDVNRMLFLERDMSKVQLLKPLGGKTGETWNYSSGTTNLLSGLIRNQFNSHQEYLNFWYGELIDKIGMHSMTVETDLAGNFVGSSYCLATARDWAKFGLLFLRKGNWKGDQILSEQWINYTATPAPGSQGTYGAHFWLNAEGKYPDVPRDLIACCGFQGQYIFIIPSKDLVVVRFGLTEHPVFDINYFLQGIIDSII